MDNNGSGFGVGVLIAFGVVYLAIVVVAVWAYVNIIRRAGYSGWWVLIGLVPIVNLVMFLVFAFKEWPTTRELNYYRAQARADGYGQGGYGQGGGSGQGGYGQGGGYPTQY